MEYPRVFPVGIFLLVAAITALSVFGIESGERQNERAELRERTQAVASALERRSSSISAYLRAGRALFDAVDEVTPENFDRFVGNLEDDAINQGTDGIGWAERVRGDQVTEYEKRFTQLTGRQVSVSPQPAADDDQLIIVTYLRPKNERNKRAAGYDMYSEPVRRAAMDEAVSLQAPVASGKLVLKQEGSEGASGFIVYLPVFHEGRTPKRLKGFIYSPINARALIDSALELESRGGKGLRLYDGAKAASNLLVEIDPKEETGLYVTERVRIGTKEMVLEIESTGTDILSPLSIVTLVFGFMVASLLLMMVRLLTKQIIEDNNRIAWWEDQNSIRDTLSRELNHRVKNTLANVLSIIALTRRRSTSLEGFADSLDGRVRALSATHDLLTQSHWGPTPIRALIEAELAPYAQQSDAILELDGPNVEVAPKDALSLGLAIHELATNAAKYGALSRLEGKVRISWVKLSEDFVKVDWVESGGPAVASQRKAGFGMNLIEKIVSHELQHPVELKFDAGGVTCCLTVPLRKTKDFAIRASREP